MICEIDFIQILEKIYNTKRGNINEKYIRNQKYLFRDYIINIIQLLKGTCYWRQYNGNINGRTLNNKFNESHQSTP